MQESISRYLDPLTDFGFKYLFGGESNKEVMISFLNSLFIGEYVIIDLDYSQTEYAGENTEYKKVFFDLMCTTDNGNQLIIEMQRNEQSNFRDRFVYYLSRLISSQLPKGKTQWNKQLKAVCLIGLLDFELKDSHKNRYLNKISLMNTDTGGLFYDRFEFKFLELPRFDKKEHELVTALDKWMFLFKNMHQLKEVPAALNEEIFHTVFNIAEMNNLKKAKRLWYESNMKAKSDYMNCIAFAGEVAMEKGLEKGLEKGMYDKAVEIAREMKQECYSLAQIVRLTKLPAEEVELL